LEERGFGFTMHKLPYDDVPIGIEIYNEADNTSERLVEEIRGQGRLKTLLAELENSDKLSDNDMKTQLENRLDFKYPYAYLEGLTVKTTVSELKRASYEEVYNESAHLEDVVELSKEISKESYIPRFAKPDDSLNENQKETRRGTQYGTAVHRFMELLSFDEKLLTDNDKQLYAIICSERDGWIKEGVVGKDELSCVSVAKIRDFMKSDLAGRIVKANADQKLFREQPFVMGVNANKLKSTYPESETVLIQGVIDLFFYENNGTNDEIVLADYKTDRVNTADELIKRYKTRLDYYQMALERITGKKVKERYIYSFALGQEIKC
jgi:ATP-dependent helicase/nuclease subunit A